MPIRTVALNENSLVQAHADVELDDSGHAGRVAEFRAHNHGLRKARVTFGRTNGKGHFTERVIDPSGTLRAIPGAGLDPDIHVTITKDGAAEGVAFTLEILPLEEPAGA